MNYRFDPSIDAAWERVDAIDPIKYAKTRNYLNGSVSYLSPYISRGVISTKQVVERLLKNGHQLSQMEVLLKELAWRDYFQRVAQNKNLDTDIKQSQGKLNNQLIPEAIVNATTGIIAIDKGITDLYKHGYMHNHLRMYTASIVCNIAQSHWKLPAQWMYYHLLDADFASNICSWQWVAGANSSKLYFANQENINTYTQGKQHGTFLDCTYEQLTDLNIPEVLKPLFNFKPQTQLPKNEVIQLNSQFPTLVYTFYNLDPLWHSHGNYNRVLLLDPNLFERYPISHLTMDFMLQLARQIPSMQVFVGSFAQLKLLAEPNKIIFKEHPLQTDFVGVQEPRDWLAPSVTGYYPSFFAYWKKISKALYS